MMKKESSPLKSSNIHQKKKLETIASGDDQQALISQVSPQKKYKKKERPSQERKQSHPHHSSHPARSEVRTSKGNNLPQKKIK